MQQVAKLHIMRSCFYLNHVLTYPRKKDETIILEIVLGEESGRISNFCIVLSYLHFTVFLGRKLHSLADQCSKLAVVSLC